jgi:hypothetical protein
MDCYRIVGEDQLAELAAHEVIRSSTDFDGTLRKPMRVAEAEIMLGVSPPETASPSRPSITDGGHWPVNATPCLRC